MARHINHKPKGKGPRPKKRGTPMKIIGVEGIAVADLEQELQRGARFVIYQYCISIVVMTFKRGTDIYFVRADQNRVVRGLPWTLLSLLLGWWGIPWGPIYTIQALYLNLGGGRDVTDQVRVAMAPRQPAPQARA